MSYQLPVLQVRSKIIVQYYQYQQLGGYNSRLKIFQQQNMKEQRTQAYSGKLTQGAAKRLRKAIELLCMSIKPITILNPVTKRYHKHRLSFITLTISQHKNITAQEAYSKCLAPLLRYLREKHKMNTYVWKAEVQKRGQIHYHITTPTFLHWQQLRDTWNNLQRKAGYLNDYHSKKGHYNANSTDIHEVRHVTDLASYLMKEFAKSIQNPNTDGKVWDCSLNLKKHKYYTTNMEDWHVRAIEQLEAEGRVWVDHHDRFSIIKCIGSTPSEIITIQDMRQLDKHLKDIMTKN